MGRVFISYRREDAAADANALYQSLRAEFDADQLFKDVDDVPLGANWKVAVREAVLGSSVVLAVMGRGWRATPAIRLELETAFDADIPVIPLLVGGVSFDDLLPALEGRMAELADRNAANVDHASWNRDLIPVITAIRPLLAPVRPPAPSLPANDREEAPVEPPTTSTEWTATVTHNPTHTRFELDLALTHATLRLEWKANTLLPGGTVRVDGATVSKSAGLSRESHSFAVVDGGVVRRVLMDVTGVMTPIVDRLVVDDQEVPVVVAASDELHGDDDLSPPR